MDRLTKIWLEISALEKNVGLAPIIEKMVKSHH